MKQLLSIGKWVSNIRNQRNLLAGILLVILFMNLRHCNSNSAIENTYKQNITALSDSIRVYQTKNGSLVYEKAAFITENGSLKTLNSELASELEYLKDNPIVIIKYKTKIVRDTVEVPIYPTKPGIWTDGVFTQSFDWALDEDYGKGNYRKINGEFDVNVDTTYQLSTSKLRLTTDELGIAFTTGLTENKDGLLEIFVRSDYPGFKPTSLDGALVDPKNSKVLQKYFPPKRWALGVYGGYGFYGDLQNNTFGHGVQLGVGLQYNLIQWNFKK